MISFHQLKDIILEFQPNSFTADAILEEMKHN
jgi:hypothetical protein